MRHMVAAPIHMAVSLLPIAASLSFTVVSSLHIVVTWNLVAATVIASRGLQFLTQDFLALPTAQSHPQLDGECQAGRVGKSFFFAVLSLCSWLFLGV
jgi:hypothetical protein